MGVVTQNPNSLTSTAKSNLEKFINSFPDQQPGYKPDWWVQLVSSMFGYNYKTTYSMSDLGKIEQSEAVCKWSQKP
jgi:hypothetical protein